MDKGLCNVMDLGFGRGEISLKLAQHPNVKRVIAIDYSPAAGKILLSHLQNNDTLANKIDVIISDASHFLSLLGIPIIDHIVAFDVIEHLMVYDIIMVFRHAARLLPKGGKIFVITPLSQYATNERHVWLARKPEDLGQFSVGQFGVGFDFRYLGYAGSGEDHKFEFTKL